MFTNISWSSYLMLITIFLVLYYLIVGLRFYHDEVKQIFSGKRLLSNTEVITPEPFAVAQSLSDELHAFLHEAGRKDTPKEEVIQSLQALLGKYPLPDKGFMISIQNLIERESKMHCSVHLSEEELVGLWKVNGASL